MSSNTYQKIRIPFQALPFSTIGFPVFPNDPYLTLKSMTTLIDVSSQMMALSLSHMPIYTEATSSCHIQHPCVLPSLTGPSLAGIPSTGSGAKHCIPHRTLMSGELSGSPDFYLLELKSSMHLQNSLYNLGLYERLTVKRGYCRSHSSLGSLGSN
jgi:hypothetical protein